MKLNTLKLWAAAGEAENRQRTVSSLRPLPLSRASLVVDQRERDETVSVGQSGRVCSGDRPDERRVIYFPSSVSERVEEKTIHLTKIRTTTCICYYVA